MALVIREPKLCARPLKRSAGPDERGRRSGGSGDGSGSRTPAGCGTSPFLRTGWEGQSKHSVMRARNPAKTGFFRAREIHTDCRHRPGQRAFIGCEQCNERSSPLYLVSQAEQSPNAS